jgi:hypothetical protein
LRLLRARWIRQIQKKTIVEYDNLWPRKVLRLMPSKLLDRELMLSMCLSKSIRVVNYISLPKLLKMEEGRLLAEANLELLLQLEEGEAQHLVEELLGLLQSDLASQ